MLKLDYVVIDFEGFKHKNEPYLIKEISVFGSSYQDTLSLKPQCHWSSTRGEKTYIPLVQQTFTWSTLELMTTHSFTNSLPVWKFAFQTQCSMQKVKPSAATYAVIYSTLSTWNWLVVQELLNTPILKIESVLTISIPTTTLITAQNKEVYLFYCWLLNQINRNGCVTLQSSSSRTTSLPESDTDHVRSNTNNRPSDGSGR